MTTLRLLLGGARRVTGVDDLGQGLLRCVPLAPSTVAIASHALGYRPLVDRLVACRALGSRVRVVVEGRNLVEEVAGDHFGPGGDAEPLRRALCALWRANVPAKVVRAATRLHANIVLSDAGRTLLATSANLTAGGLGGHADGGIAITDAHVYEAMRAEVIGLWNGALERRDAAGTTVESRDGSITVHVGARADMEHALGRLVASARSRVRFAVFAFSSHSTVGQDLVGRVERGVDVKGVVDGDQAGLPYDAVPLLRGAGVDVRYVPGVLTGATRRMHHKLVVSDGSTLAIGTHNLSASARSHYEVVVIARGPGAKLACTAAEEEIAYLFGEARAAPPRWHGGDEAAGG
jgi:phosphatidylserine/phosphatidylglycerophosphate/cardiolipin synthase-like enzyme